VGGLFWLARGEQRRGVIANLARIRGSQAGPADGLRSLGTFVAFARSFAEGFAALSARRDDVVIEVENEDVLDAVAAEGKGCIVLTAHTSSFEVAAAGLTRALRVPFVMAMRREPNASGRAVQDAVRREAGLTVHHVDTDPLAALQLAHHLRRGSFVGLQIDRLPPGIRGVPVRLFGQPSALPLGPFVLARATGAPLVCALTRRTGFLQVRIRSSAPVRLDRRASEAEIAQAAQRMADELSAWVSEAPTEWLDWGQSSPPDDK
jgi:lauroyl/myristoyl acyltransferase